MTDEAEFPTGDVAVANEPTVQQRLEALSDQNIMRRISEGEDFATLAKERIKLEAEYKKTQREQNAGIINQLKVDLRNQISSLVEASGLANLIGEPVNSILWRSGAEHPAVLVNARRVSKTPSAEGQGGKRGKRPTYSVSVGSESMTAREFCDRFADDAERKLAHFENWPTKLAETIVTRLASEGTEATISRQ